MGYLLRILFIHNPDIYLLIHFICYQYAPLAFRHVRRIEKGDYESRRVSPSTGRVWYFKIFRKYLDKFQVSLKPNNNNAHFNTDLSAFMIIIRSILLIMENVSGKLCTENLNLFYVH
jgi:hypothetical protein